MCSRFPGLSWVPQPSLHCHVRALSVVRRNIRRTRREVGRQNWPMFVRIRPSCSTFYRFRVASGESGQISPDVRQCFAEFELMGDFGQVWPDCSQAWAMPGEFVPNQARCCLNWGEAEFRSKLAQIPPFVWRARPKLDQMSPTFRQIWAIPADIGPISAKHCPEVANFWQLWGTWLKSDQISAWGRPGATEHLWSLVLKSSCAGMPHAGGPFCSIRRARLGWRGELLRALPVAGPAGHPAVASKRQRHSPSSPCCFGRAGGLRPRSEPRLCQFPGNKNNDTKSKTRKAPFRSFQMSVQ